jgi:hypothetical protein
MSFNVSAAIYLGIIAISYVTLTKKFTWTSVFSAEQRNSIYFDLISAFENYL